MPEEKVSLLLQLKDKITTAVSKIKANFKKNMGAMKSSALIFAGGFAGVVAGIWKSITAFKEQERVEAELENRLISTGHAAGLTAEEIKNMASELQKTTGVSDEVTLSAQNMLLTFTNIGKESFPAATEAVLDMTAAMNKGKITNEGLKASAIMLGKGLNDPIGQLGALSRVGIAFTDQQKLQIKSMAKAGDMAGAQAIILAELKKEFGGTASNLDTLEGAQRAASAAVGDAMEVIGEAFLPIARSFLILIKDIANKMQRWLPRIKDLIAPITILIGSITGLLAVGGAVVTLGPAIGAAFTVMLGPVGLVVAAIAGLTATLLYFKNSNSELAIKVRSIWKTLAEIVGKYAEAMSLGLKFKFKESGKAYKELVQLIADSKNVFAENVEAEKEAIAASIEAKEEEAAKKQEIQLADNEAKIEMDQDFIDRKAEMDAVAEDARKAFEKQKKLFDNMSAAERIKLLTDTLGKEKIARTAAQIDELITKGKHDEAKKAQDKLYHEAFVKLNKETIEKLGSGWKTHWTTLLAGAKLNAEQRKKVDNVMVQAFDDVLTLMGEKSIEAFRIMQAASIAQTIIKTYEAAQNAYAALSGIPIIGPILGGIAAGVAGAAGLARVEKIRQQRPPAMEKGGRVVEGGVAELHPAEVVLNKTEAENINKPQTNYFVMDEEVIATWVTITENIRNRMIEEGKI